MKYLQKFLKGFLKDRRGVTPVVGVILMVAVTVVMGAVIAGFVYGYVGTTQKGPLVGLSVVDDPVTEAESFLIKHTGGEAIDAGDWKLSVTQGRDAATLFDFASLIDEAAGDETAGVIDTPADAAADLYAGRTLKVIAQTTGTAETGNANPGVVLEADFYHVVIVHAPSNSLLLDTNVQVR